MFHRMPTDAFPKLDKGGGWVNVHMYIYVIIVTQVRTEI